MLSYLATSLFGLVVLLGFFVCCFSGFCLVFNDLGDGEYDREEASVDTSSACRTHGTTLCSQAVN